MVDKSWWVFLWLAGWTLGPDSLVFSESFLSVGCFSSASCWVERDFLLFSIFILVDMEDLKNFAKSQGSSEAVDLSHWDLNFWSERLRELKYDINEVRSLFFLNCICQNQTSWIIYVMDPVHYSKSIGEILIFLVWSLLLSLI